MELFKLIRFAAENIHTHVTERYGKANSSQVTETAQTALTSQPRMSEAERAKFAAQLSARYTVDTTIDEPVAPPPATTKSKTWQVAARILSGLVTAASVGFLGFTAVVGGPLLAMGAATTTAIVSIAVLLKV